MRFWSGLGLVGLLAVVAGCSSAGGGADAADAQADEDGSPPPDDGGFQDEDQPDGDSGADEEPVADGEDGGSDAGDLGEDAGQDGGADGGDEACPDADPFDYHCEMSDPESCPGGICLVSMCIGAVLDPDRWSDCGDGDCGTCEGEENCPADCGEPPATTGQKEYDNGTTITVWVHGFYNKTPADIEEMVYGGVKGCGGILGELATYGIVRPCGNTPAGEVLPNHLIGVEYYGAIPAPWFTPGQVAEIEALPYDGPEALDRYARIVAWFIRHRLTLSGATHVNLACHSMGCLVSRHLIENDIEGLASENRFVRWFTSAGVIGGAQLSRLYDNPTVREWAPVLGMELTDFVIMHPDFVQDHTAVWDHRLREGNHPLLSGMLIHHAAACDPKIAQALNIALLDLRNPGDAPNDGIMFNQDEYFHTQSVSAGFTAPGGEVLSATHTYGYFDHMTLPETDAAAVVATAGLFHRRKVFVTLDQVELIADREHHEAFDGETGTPPAEIAIETRIRFSPFLEDTFGKDVLVHDDRVEPRTAPLFIQEQGVTAQPGLVLFAGPVFDGMDSLWIGLNVLEMDWYPRFGVSEWAFDTDQRLLEHQGQLPLADTTVDLESEYLRARLKIEVVDLY